MKKYIRLEPHTAFKKAIVKRSKGGCLTYNYYKIVKICMDLNKWEMEAAIEWVDYNIVTLSSYGFRLSYRR